MGNGLTYGVALGPINNRMQHDKVSRLVADAARPVLSGGIVMRAVLISIGIWEALCLALAILVAWGKPAPVLGMFVVSGIAVGSLYALGGIGLVVLYRATMLLALPALRMRGLYLALVTLMVAGGLEVVFTAFQFPNGGSGFWGVGTSFSAPRCGDRPSRPMMPTTCAIVLRVLRLASC
jgi:ABC-type branched-subunit amino acid transport system permease subunit